MKRYDGMIWIGDQPGKSIQIFADSASEAGKKLKELYGEGHEYTLSNEEERTALR